MIILHHPGRPNDVIARLPTRERKEDQRPGRRKQRLEGHSYAPKSGHTSLWKLDKARNRVLSWSFQKEPALLTSAWFLDLLPSEL